MTSLFRWQVNLRHGILKPLSRTGTESDTCTACAGTMILEFAALSRLSGQPVFEVLLSSNYSHILLVWHVITKAYNFKNCTILIKLKAVCKTLYLIYKIALRFILIYTDIVFQEHARKALDVLWERRQKGSDLVGTVINIHNGEWVRRGEEILSLDIFKPSNKQNKGSLF